MQFCPRQDRNSVQHSKGPCWCGPHSSRFSQVFFRCLVQFHWVCSIPIIHQYKHVGKVFQAEICDNLDIFRAARNMHGKHLSMRQKVLRNKRSPFSNKSIFASGILVPSLLSNGATWHHITTSAMSLLDKHYSAIYRDLYTTTNLNLILLLLTSCFIIFTISTMSPAS